MNLQVIVAIFLGGYMLSLGLVTGFYSLFGQHIHWDKRNKLWRRQQMARVFKARMILYAAYGHPIIHDDGSVVEHPHWFELAKDNGQRFINLRELHAAAGFAEGKDTIVESIRRKLCALFENLLKIKVRVTSFRLMG